MEPGWSLGGLIPLSECMRARTLHSNAAPARVAPENTQRCGHKEVIRSPHTSGRKLMKISPVPAKGMFIVKATWLVDGTASEK